MMILLGSCEPKKQENFLSFATPQVILVYSKQCTNCTEIIKTFENAEISGFYSLMFNMVTEDDESFSKFSSYTLPIVLFETAGGDVIDTLTDINDTTLNNFLKDY
jgi:hypothetical protein